MSDRTTKIKVALLLKNKEVNDLAEEIGVTRGYLSPIINGKRTGKKPNEVLEEVEKILEVDKLVCKFD